MKSSSKISISIGVVELLGVLPLLPSSLSDSTIASSSEEVISIVGVAGGSPSPIVFACSIFLPKKEEIFVTCEATTPTVDLMAVLTPKKLVILRLFFTSVSLNALFPRLGVLLWPFELWESPSGTVNLNFSGACRNASLK